MQHQNSDHQSASHQMPVLDGYVELIAGQRKRRRPEHCRNSGGEKDAEEPKIGLDEAPSDKSEACAAGMGNSVYDNHDKGDDNHEGEQARSRKETEAPP